VHPLPAAVGVNPTGLKSESEGAAPPAERLRIQAGRSGLALVIPPPLTVCVAVRVRSSLKAPLPTIVTLKAREAEAPSNSAMGGFNHLSQGGQHNAQASAVQSLCSAE
jgi:hypothetical protein